MSWGEVELEPEVRDWFLTLNEEDQARVGFHIDRLAGMGPLLDEPFTKQLYGKAVRSIGLGGPTSGASMSNTALRRTDGRQGEYHTLERGTRSATEPGCQ